MLRHIGQVAVGAIVSLALVVAFAFAQSGGLGSVRTSPVVVPGFFPFNGGPQVTSVPSSGGTVTCSAGGTPTVANTRLTVNSVVMFGLRTAGGTPVIPTMTTVTPGTSFVVTCGGADTSVWNYVILG